MFSLQKTENPNGKHASIGHSIHKTLFLLFTFHKVICLLIHLGGTNGHTRLIHYFQGYC